MYRWIIYCVCLMTLGCNTPEQTPTTETSANADSNETSTKMASDPPATPTNKHERLQLLRDVIVPLPTQRIVASTSRDTEFDEYLFTPLSAQEQQALEVNTVFGGDQHPYKKLPPPDIYAAGKMAELKTGYVVLFCSVYNIDLHLYRLHIASYDADARLTDQAFLGQMDFITPGLEKRKYWLIFSDKRIEFAKGKIYQRRIISPCVVVQPRHSKLMKTEQTCSRNR